MRQLTAADEGLIDLLQEDLPPVPRPFEVIAGRLGLPEDDVIRRTGEMCREGFIREISAIIDFKKLGYKSTLVAVEADEEKAEEIAAAISADPRVSHNYRRPALFTIWFTMSVPKTENFDDVLSRLLAVEGVKSYLCLPAERVFKLGVHFRFRDKAGSGTKAGTAAAVPGPEYRPDAREAAVLTVLQEPLEITGNLWDLPAEKIGIGRDDLLSTAGHLKGEGVIKRISAVVRHYRIGFNGNGMACFNLPPSDVLSAGERLAAYPEVSHCYQRARYGRWPYSLYAMVHKRTQEECRRLVETMAKEIGCGDWRLLFSDREYKKERVKYIIEKKEG